MSADPFKITVWNVASARAGGTGIAGEELIFSLMPVRNNEIFGKEISLRGKLSEKKKLIDELGGRIKVASGKN